MKSIYMVIKKEHEAVEEIINLLKERLKAIPIHSEAISQEEVEELRFLFSYFLKRIQFHFDVEETLGFIEDLRNRHPDASRTVHHILDGHREIRKKMDHVIQQISVLDYLRTEPATSLIDLFKDITEEIQKHEEEENSAALMAVNQDTGNKD